MRRVLSVLVTGGVFIALAWVIAELPGHVTAELDGTTIEAATPVVVTGFLALLLLGYWASRLLSALLNLPALTSRWRADRRRRGGDAAVTQTLVALAAGDHAKARRAAHRTRAMLGDTPQTLLLAAEAGRLADRDDETEAAYRALADNPDAALLGYRGLFRLAVARQDWREAAALAAQAEKAYPGASWFRPERGRLAVRAGDWAAALALSDPGTPRAALGTAAALAEPNPAFAANLAKQAWKDDPTLAPAVLAYAATLRSAGKERRALSILRHAWTLAPHPDIAEAALSEVSSPLDRAKAAQRLTNANPEHAESRLLLARTALEAGLTGEARHQVEAAQAAGFNQRRLWLLRAEIDEAEHKDGRAALRHAADALPDPIWRCQACHAEHDLWRGACRSCATAGSLRWVSGPPKPRLTIDG